MLKTKIAIVLLALLAFVPYAQKSEKPIVNYRADKSILKDKGAYAELIGNVVFYHNGVFITCDTAYRYSEQHMEGVGNVIINSDSTYIYGDKFTYNGETNIAQIFAPLIKTIDKDAILYTHNMEFNTLENSGTYYGGGTVTQGTNLMESDRGIYYANNRSILLTGNVEMKNDNYKIVSDSINYNFDSEIVTFLTLTDIWNENGEFLRAEKGNYNTQKQVYDFYQNAYILTEEQELWSDSLVYYSQNQNAHLTRNIQMFDSTKRVYMVGDNGRYWGLSKRVMMTLNPAVVAYNEFGGDSTFMRADTFLMIPMLDPTKKMIATQSIDKDSLTNQIENIAADSSITDNKTALDSLAQNSVVEPDSTASKEQEKVTTPSKKELKAAEKAEKRAIKAAEQKKKFEAKRIAREEKERIKAILKAEKAAAREKKHKHHDHNHDHGCDHDHAATDSLAKDSTINKSATESVMPEDTVLHKTAADSSDYFIYGKNNVMSYKEDMQMVCDSMVINSMDSTSTLYSKPVVWNMANQVTADSLKLYTLNEQPYKAELYNFPILAQEILPKKYNQIRGKYMEAYFTNNEIDILYVDGNSQSLYYRLENEDDKEASAIIDVTSANMIILFDSTQISDIKWFDNYVFDVIPMEKLTEEHSETLEGFKWEGDRRPKSPKAITERKLKESIRSKMIKIPQPSFMITDVIDREKIDFTEQGIWRDRTEDLPIDRDAMLQFFLNL